MKMHNRNVLISPSNNKEMLDNGIVVDTVIGNRMQIVTGKVLSFASDCPSGEIKEGDVVYYPMYGARQLSVKGITYHVVAYDDIEMSEEDGQI
jgi:co-chaperonin GroES (HSP10)